MPESEWQTRKQRIDTKLEALGWTICPHQEGMDYSGLSCHAVEELPTQSGPADYGLFVDGQLLGILEAKKIAGMAEAHYAELAPHLYCGPIEAAANIQVATCSPNFLIQESIEKFDGFHAELLKTPIQWEDGYIIPPTKPGLGVELNEEVARNHPYTGDMLHLEMTQHPVF